MTQNTYRLLDELAEEHIPEGVHQYLHIDSRKSWLIMMTNLMESGYVKRKYTTLRKCAINWEALLAEKYSIQN